MVAVPTPFPVTTPPDVIDAMPALLLLQMPPPVASVKVALPPRHILMGTGVIAAGLGPTLTVAVA